VGQLVRQMFGVRLDTLMTPSALDARRKSAGRQWTRSLGKTSNRIAPESTDFRLPSIRNQQVIGSRPIAGSRKLREIQDLDSDRGSGRFEYAASLGGRPCRCPPGKQRTPK